MPFSVTQPIVERFLFNQNNLLADFPNGGDSLSNRVAVIASSSRAAIAPLLRLTRAASAKQRQAIAAGLAVAAQRCESRQPQTSRYIAATVAALPDRTIQNEFRAHYRTAGDRFGDPAPNRRPSTETAAEVPRIFSFPPDRPVPPIAPSLPR